MATRRTYGEGCAAAHALDLVGERWALLVVRDLVLGPKRFTDLRGGVPGASPNVLAERLRELERAGAVRRRKLAPPAGSWVYELTEWGAELEPVLSALGRWGARSPSMPFESPIGVDALILALRTMFDPASAQGVNATLDLRLYEDRFALAVAGGGLEIARGDADRPEAVLTTDPGTLEALVFAGRPLADALRAGDASLEGDPQAVERVVALFPLPTPAQLPAVA
jgi:DNA-binding HxlR family transcriptional regulator